MPYYVTKTGLDFFDTARAWGLAVLFNALTEEEVAIRDDGWSLILEPSSSVSYKSLNGLAWRTLFAEENWRGVTLSTKKEDKDEVRVLLEGKIPTVLQCLQCPSNFQKVLFPLSVEQLQCLQHPGNPVTFGKSESLPGSLEPAAFKGMRGPNRSGYSEGQLEVDETHWALACLGMALVGVYVPVKKEWFVFLPVPQKVRLNYFRDLQRIFRFFRGGNYQGFQNAAAHYAVQLAERLRRRVASQGSLEDRFTAVACFNLFKAGKKSKPGQAYLLQLTPLMEAIERDPHGSQTLLDWLDACFRLGLTKGAEDLALAVTELVTRWDFDAYEQTIRVLARVLGRDHLRKKNTRDFRETLWKTGSRDLFPKVIEVMNHGSC